MPIWCRSAFEKRISPSTSWDSSAKKRLRRRIFYLALILLISAAFFAVCVLVFFNVGEIELVGLSAATRPRSARRSASRSATICSLFRAGDVESALKKAFPYIASAEVSRGFPTKLTVTVEEEKPAACVEQYGEYFVLSRDLKVLERLTDKPEGLLFLPRVRRTSVSSAGPPCSPTSAWRIPSFGCWTPWTAAAFWIKSFRSI